MGKVRQNNTTMANRDEYFDSEEFKEMLAKFEKAQRNVAYAGLEPDELTDVAEYYYGKGDRKLSLQILNDAIEAFPGATMPLVFRGRTALIDEHDVEKAKEYARQIDDKLNLDYIYLEAEILITEDKVDAADIYLHDRMDYIDEDDVPDYVLDVATIFADYNYADLAQSWLSLSDETDLTDYKELEGRIAYGKGNYEKSERIFEKLIDEDPYSNQFWNSLASTQLMRNRINDSITSSEFSIAIDPNNDEAILNKANGLFSLGNYEEALKYYRRFTDLCPQDETGYVFQGTTLLNLNHPEEAEACFRKAESIAGPKSDCLPELYQEMAFALSMQGRANEALVYCDKAMALPENDKNEVRIMRGHILLDNNRVEDAQECFALALKASGHSPKIYLHIAVSIFDCGYTGIAYKMFKSLLEYPVYDGMEGFSYLAYCCNQMGKRKEFLENLKTACEVNPREAKLILGDLFPAALQPDGYYGYALDHEHL